MSILGKVLIFLNLLAAGAFAYLTLENYKLRHTLTARALENDVRLSGLPVEAPDGANDYGSDRVPFRYPSGSGVIESISKKDLVKILPKGGEPFGESGEPIADQTAELKRVQQKVAGMLPALNPQDPKPRFDALHGFLLNLARGGAERDGVNALFDLRDLARAGMSRRDLPLLARTSSQVAALQAAVAIADLGDPQAITPPAVQAVRIGTAREAVKQFLLGEVPHGAGGAGDRAEAERRLTNAIVNAMDGKGPKEEIANAAADKSFDQLATVAAEPLTDRASAGRAITALQNYATSKSATPTETAALTGVVTLINPPVNLPLDATIDTVATNLLNSKFDEAALAAKQSSAGEKARKIAHVLYHIDAHRHAARDEATVAARKAWHERVAAVVGLQEYVRAAEAQASEYAEASTRLLAVITEEQSAFEADYQAQVQRVQLLFTQWLTLDNAFKAQDSITAQNVKLKEQRETERNSLKESLASSILKSKQSLEKLMATQKQLFDIQKQLRDAQAALLSLETELRKLEERRVTGQK